MTAINPNDMTLDELRGALARIFPLHAAFDGWSDATLTAAAIDLGVPVDRARLAFPGGAADMVAAWIEVTDADMAEAARAQDLPLMKIRDRIRAIIWTRFRQNMPHREAVRRAVAILAMPQNAPLAAKTLWRTADAIWRAAGDEAVDFSYYTKRATVSAVYSATLLVWLNDESEAFTDTAAFLDRRIENVMQFERIKGRWRGASERRPSLTRLLGRLRYPVI